MLETWIGLKSRLKEETNRYLPHEVCTEKELLDFETKTGIILPPDYKECCQVFGSVAFGEYLEIRCPNLAYSQFWIEALKSSIDSAVRFREIDIRDVSKIENILDSAFAFGGSDTLLVLFWDLRTYSETDKNYDIYLARGEDFDGVYLVGRDFTQFVLDFCLGTKSHEILPELMHPSLQSLQPTFTPIPKLEVM